MVYSNFKSARQYLFKLLDNPRNKDITDVLNSALNTISPRNFRGVVKKVNLYIFSYEQFLSLDASQPRNPFV